MTLLESPKVGLVRFATLEPDHVFTHHPKRSWPGELPETPRSPLFLWRSHQRASLKLTYTLENRPSQKGKNCSPTTIFQEEAVRFRECITPKVSLCIITSFTNPVVDISNLSANVEDVFHGKPLDHLSEKDGENDIFEATSQHVVNDRFWCWEMWQLWFMIVSLLLLNRFKM